MSSTVLLVSVATLMASITLNEVTSSSPICYEAGKQVSMDPVNNTKLNTVIC
jgi:hypothetical protein